MKNALYRFDCPTPHQLGEYHLGLAGAAEAEALARHVTECPLCQADLATLKNFMQAEAVRPVVEPQVEAAPRSARGWVQEVIARLLPSTPATALRGSAPEQIMAEADGLTILLSPQAAADGRLIVSGQIAAEDQDRWTEAVVQVRRAEELLATAIVDDLGGFRCGGVSAGPAQIRITPRTGPAVSVPEIRVGG